MVVGASGFMLLRPSVSLGARQVLSAVSESRVSFQDRGARFGGVFRARPWSSLFWSLG